MSDSIFKVPKLKGSQNYDLWSIRISAILVEKDCGDCIFEEPSVITIKEKSDKATALIKLSLEDGPLLQTRFISEPKTLWDSLKNLYESKGFSSEFILSKELINNSLNNNKGNLEAYLNSFKRISNSLEAKDIKLPDKFLVALLLNNLNKEYEYIVAVITQDLRVNNYTTIDLDEIMRNLLDEARRLNSIKSKNYSFNTNYSNNTISNNKANISNPNNKAYTRNNSDYSNDIEMAMNTSNTKKFKKSSNNTSKTCSYCNIKGHLEHTCYKKFPHLNPNKKSINNTRVSKEKETILATNSISKYNIESSTTIDFILDSGATIHTCYIKELFSNIKPTNKFIKWGNTTKDIAASGIGDIKLYFNSTNSIILLKDVLYVPELGVNLLSVNLITSKNLTLSFNKDNCIIYLPNKAILAIGYYINGVSVFKATSSKLIKSYNNKNKTLAILSTYTINNNSIEELDSEDNLNLVDPNLEELEIENSINLEDTSNIEDNSILNKDLSNNSSTTSSNKEQLVIKNNTIELAHQRLGHISLKAIKYLLNNTYSSFINIKDIELARVNLDNCIICIQSKLTKNRSTTPSTKVEGYLDLIYIDIGGPIRPKTYRGYKYYITFRDSFTKYLIVKLLKTRKDISLIIEDTITELELEAINNSSSNLSNNSNIIKPFNNNKVKALQLDNEFISKELTSYLAKKGIKIRFSSPYTPEQNGAAEIINRILLNKVRALLFTSNLPKNLWGEAIITSTYLYNRTPSSSINFKTPYELKYKVRPNINNIRIFGSLVYNREPELFRKKLDLKATPYYLIGFITNNIYKLYNPRTNRITTSRDCKILEGYFYKPNNNSNIQEIYTRIEDLSSRSNNRVINKPNTTTIIEEDYSEDELANITKDNSKRILNTIESSSNYRSDWKSLFNQSIIYNIYNTISNNSNNILEPKNYKEVMLRKDKELYLAAMKLEIEDLLKSNTWNIVKKPNNTTIIKGRWVLNKKYNLDNTIKKYKARWVAKGFLQQYNINYKETFASTSKPSIIRLLLSIAAYLNWEIYTWDVKQAFPNAEIDNNNLYMQLPIGLEDFILNKTLETIKDKELVSTINKAISNKDYKNIACKLNKALYGLKQASRQWQLFLTSILEKLGFTSLKIDNSVFIHKDKAIILATHVDDILVFASSIDLVNNLYKDLATISKLEITNLGEIKEFLGVEIIRDRSRRSLIITQRSFISKILEKYNKLNNKPKALPLPIGVKISKNLEENDSTITKNYQQQIGSLIYLTIFTRPDLVYSVNYLARFMSNPSLEHLNYLNSIFSYLLKTRDLGLDLTLESVKQSTTSSNKNYYNTINSINLLGVSDADWGGDLDSRKSTIGNIFLLNNIKDNYSSNSIAISWISKLQKIVALSSAEAEYMSLKEATKESLYLQNFIKELSSYNNNSLKEFNSLFNKANIIKTDSLSAIELAKNPVYHARTKHVDITYHFVRENLLSNNIELVYENTSTILADNLTKSTSIAKFQDYKNRIGLINTRNL